MSTRRDTVTHAPRRHRPRGVAAAALALALAGCTASAARPDRQTLVQQVTAAEIAFAKTMADRDHNAFLGFVSDEAVFVSGGKPLRGKAAIGENWKRFYTSATAPFSWKPDLIEVLGSGTLALSSGPVMSASGKLIARFQSTWRLEADGRWRVVFDNGSEVCDCPPKP